MRRCISLQTATLKQRGRKCACERNKGLRLTEEVRTAERETEAREAERKAEGMPRPSSRARLRSFANFIPCACDCPAPLAQDDHMTLRHSFPRAPPRTAIRQSLLCCTANTSRRPYRLRAALLLTHSCQRTIKTAHACHVFLHIFFLSSFMSLCFRPCRSCPALNVYARFSRSLAK